jgi:adenine-specific DNA-methyltransferase
LFESREHAFQEDDVLQETLILSAVKTPCTSETSTILITNTTGSTNDVVAMHTVPYHEVISPHDPQSCIRIVSDEGDQQIAKRMATLPATLEDLGIEVSTGRVVDFRVEALLRLHPEEGTVPLLYPAHISSGEVVWPSQEVRKPGALVVTEQSRDLLVPNEPYVLVRRFSSKEEKRRVVAVLYEPQALPASHVAFENHLNYFHQHGRGLDPLVAKGLAAFLNSTFVDMYFRLFNGHTQVNATDLRHMRYPTRELLAELATRLPTGKPTQQSIDILIEEILFPMNDHQAMTL